MLSKVLTGTTLGVSAYIVEVETHLERALPAFSIVGLPDCAVRESRGRIAAAVRNSGFEFPPRKLTVNLAPGDIRKEGCSFDLPMAVGILAAGRQMSIASPGDVVVIGELSLDGTLRPVRGILPIAMEVRRRGIAGLIVPSQNGREAAIVRGLCVYPMASLREVVTFLDGADGRREPLRVDPDSLMGAVQNFPADFSDVKGQESVKRALEVAAAGAHNIIMIGPPGSGKTMLARRVPTILPPMSFEEALETTKIHSVAGILPPGDALVVSRPFRSPHHTISDAALVGGGAAPRAGEISLAHNGVLFLDELPEFARSVLEVLRQPLEEGHVRINRSRGSVDFPAGFMLVCAMNPCPCGYATDPAKECTCRPGEILRYLSRISGPLLDRIDLHIEVPAVRYKELASREAGESSTSIRERVILARAIQMRRYEGRKGMYSNADMQSRDMQSFCRLDTAGEELMKMAITKLGLSARAYDRIRKVARTIADLSSADSIRPEHISEAIQYRSLDRNLWESQRLT